MKSVIVSKRWRWNVVWGGSLGILTTTSAFAASSQNEGAHFVDMIFFPGFWLVTGVCIFIIGLFSLALFSLSRRLGQKQRQFETTLERVPLGVLWFGIEGDIHDVNDAMVEMMGHTSPQNLIEERHGIMQSLFASIDGYAVFMDMLKQQGRFSGADLMLRRNDGVVLRMECTAFAESSKYSSTRFQGFFRNVTLYRREQKSLVDNTNRLELALGAANAGIWDFYPGTDKASFDNQWFIMLGYQPDVFEHTFDTWIDLIHPDDVHEMTRKLDAYIKTSASGVFETRFRMKAASETWRWVLCTGKTVAWDDSGKPIRIIGINLDIHKQTVAEEHIRVSEMTYRELFNAFQDSILLQEPGTGIILDANKTLLERFAYESLKELRGVRFEDLSAGMPPYGRAEVEALLQYTQLEGPQHVEWLVRTRHGDFFWAEVKTKIVTLLGERRILVHLRDISEKKQAEVALRESEGLFRAMFDQTVQYMGLLGVKGRILKVNRALLELAGVRAQDVIGLPFAVAPWVQQTSESQEFIDRAIHEASEGIVVQREIIFVDQHDQQHIVDFSLAPFRGDTGNIVSLIAEGRDMTDLRNALQALNVNRKQLEMTLEAVNAGIFELYPESDTIEWTRGWRTALGYDEQEIGADLAHWNYLVHPEDRVRVVNHFFNAVSSASPGEIFEIEYRLQCKDGHYMWVKTKALSSSFNLQGDVVQVQGITYDIQQDKEVQARLRASEKKYKEIFNAGAEAIGVIDPNNFSIAEANSAFIDMFNLTVHTLYNQHITDLFAVAADGTCPPVDALEQSHEGGTLSFQGQGKTAEKTFLVEGTVKTVALDGKLQFLLVVRDVTERRRLQEIMIQSEKMLSVGGLAAGMAHEINNPLGVILQSIQNVIRRSKPGTKVGDQAASACGLDFDTLRCFLNSTGIDETYEDIRGAGVRAAKIVEDMLSFSRKTDSTLNKCSLLEITQRAINLAKADYNLRKKYDFKNIDLQIDHEDDLPNIPCLENEIEQVILNLLRNAAHALAESGPEHPSIHITIRQNNDEIELQVCDNGPGMYKDVARRIFEPFFTTKEAGTGTGLGLSVSYFIVTERHGGHLSVTTEPGEGSCFLMSLPISRETRRDMNGAISHLTTNEEKPV